MSYCPFELSIFFSDLEGFSSFSENLSPEQLTQLLNTYLTAMTAIIHEEGGTIDKYEGDAIIAFWNAPLPVPDHAQRAVRTAIRCQQKLEEIRPELREKFGYELFMRIGVNTGPVVVGNMGSEQRFDYTVLGDAANLASRLEGINKVFGTYTMISEKTRNLLGPDFPARELSRVTVVGREEPVRVYEPMTIEQFNQRKEVLAKFALALDDFYHGKFDTAFTKFQAIRPDDPADRAYMDKCSEFSQNPPAIWEGIWVMDGK